jgi:RNA polymerase sigma factor (sigma-70 family)
METSRERVGSASPSPTAELCRVDAPEKAPTAFEEIYLEHAPLMRRLAVRRFGIPQSEAETLVHDVFATYLVQAASVRQVTPYLVGAICNASRQYLRKSTRETLLFCGEEPCAATPDDETTREVHRRLLLSRALARIGRRCRELLRRYYLDNEATASLADSMNTTPGSLYVHVHNCVKRAREICGTAKRNGAR